MTDVSATIFILNLKKVYIINLPRRIFLTGNLQNRSGEKFKVLINRKHYISVKIYDDEILIDILQEIILTVDIYCFTYRES